MSNNRDNYWDDEDEDDGIDLPTYEPLSDTDLVKKLRKDLKLAQRKNKELESSFNELTKSQKERILKDVIASRGVNPKIVSFVPSDLEANPEAINAWLDSNADVFGIKQPEQANPVAQQDIAAMQKMDNVLTGADTAASADSIEMRIANATSEDEILSILSGN